MNNKLIGVLSIGAPTKQGPIGPQGPRGPIGATGPQGPRGVEGPRGEVGPVGPVGPRGIQGDTGLQGEKGERGEKGEKGDRGETGLMGPIGPMGDRGPVGPRGPQGERGLQGPKGQDGRMHFDQLTQEQKDSLKGDRGERGPAGAIGPVGPRGPQGATGKQGPQGIQGQKGPQGPGVKFMGEVPSKETPTLPNKANQGDCYLLKEIDQLVVWNGRTWVSLGKLRGPQGPAGPTGAEGPTGPQGPPGERGPQGERGLTGERGPQGITGATGQAGPTGPVGPPGPIGPQGPAGKITSLDLPTGNIDSINIPTGLYKTTTETQGTFPFAYTDPVQEMDTTGTLIVICWNQALFSQEWYSMGVGKYPASIGGTYTRNYKNGQWSTWKKLLTRDNALVRQDNYIGNLEEFAPRGGGFGKFDNRATNRPPGAEWGTSMYISENDGVSTLSQAGNLMAMCTKGASVGKMFTKARENNRWHGWVEVGATSSENFVKQTPSNYISNLDDMEEFKRNKSGFFKVGASTEHKPGRSQWGSLLTMFENPETGAGTQLVTYIEGDDHGQIFARSIESAGNLAQAKWIPLAHKMSMPEKTDHNFNIDTLRVSGFYRTAGATQGTFPPLETIKDGIIITMIQNSSVGIGAQVFISTGSLFGRIFTRTLLRNNGKGFWREINLGGELH